MKKIALVVTLSVAIAAAFSTGVQAQESLTLKKIKDSGSITLGHRESSIPFSYYDDKQQVIGYSHELMLQVVDSIKAELKLAKLDTKLMPVTSANRITPIHKALHPVGVRGVKCYVHATNARCAGMAGFTRITH